MVLTKIYNYTHTHAPSPQLLFSVPRWMSLARDSDCADKHNMWSGPSGPAVCDLLKLQLALTATGGGGTGGTGGCNAFSITEVLMIVVERFLSRSLGSSHAAVISVSLIQVEIHRWKDTEPGCCSESDDKRLKKCTGMTACICVSMLAVVREILYNTHTENKSDSGSFSFSFPYSAFLHKSELEWDCVQ